MTAQDAGRVPMVQLLSPEGEYGVPSQYAEYGKYIEQLKEEDFLKFYRDMARMRRFDNEATALQRQGQLGLWIPAIGQEAAQIGSGYGVGHNDHIFPSYREHGVAITHGIDLMSILKMLRGVNHGGWNPDETRFHLYAIVLASQTLHAVGYAMGVKFDGKVGTGDLSNDQAVITYIGDGATAEGDASESFLFAATNKVPLVYFIQNNQYAISSPVDSQTTVPLFQRGAGFGVPGIRIDGNDVLASYAVTKKHMDEAREGAGPFLIEALTYRMGAHTSSDDPTKYRSDEEVDSWKARDPLARLEKFLRRQGIGQSFFDECEQAGEELSAYVRGETFALTNPPIENMFKHVYSEAHPLIEEQLAWLEGYEASFEGDASQGGAH
jgi:2-oxoisovalerate dehydrogenase E1 component alpha subunit